MSGSTKDIVAVPNLYLQDFTEDPRGALLGYGSKPQRARATRFKQVGPVDKCMILPDLVSAGPPSRTK